MQTLTERLKKTLSQSGFSLVELMVGGLVLVVGLIMLSQFFASATSRVLESDIRSVLHQVAAKEMEKIRGLPYTDVGVPGGIPDGVLIAEDPPLTVDVTRVVVQRSVIFWRDPSYEEGGPYPGNYRRVTVRVAAVDTAGNPLRGVEPVEMVTNVAGGATGGTLLVRVQDSEGLAVEGASFSIVNNTLIPNINFNSPALVTNDLGIMLVPGLKVDASGGYEVTATKDGYSSDSKTGFAVMEGATQEVILTIDELSAMRIRVVDGVGAEVAGLNLSITGPQSYVGAVVSAAGGVTVNNLRFSTTADPYIVTLPAGAGFVRQQQSVALPAGTTMEVLFTLPVVTTTTTLPPTTTTTGSGTTTTVAATTTTLGTSGSLQVKVVDHNGYALKNAWVNLEGRTAKTNDQGIVFFSNLQLRSYWIDVTRNNYHDYHDDDLAVTGATTVTISLTHN
jgi:hypothetical protein